MSRRLAEFWNAQDGAVTIDWVVLTALIVALAAAAFSGVEGGVSGLTTAIGEYLVGLLSA